MWQAQIISSYHVYITDAQIYDTHERNVKGNASKKRNSAQDHAMEDATKLPLELGVEEIVFKVVKQELDRRNISLKQPQQQEPKK